MSTFSSRVARVLAGALLVPLVASAQTADASAVRLATKDEHLACLEAADDVRARRTALASRDARHKAQLARFQAEQADLAEQVRKRPPTTPAEIDAYNRAIHGHKAQVLALNQEARAIQSDQTIANKRIVDTNTRCGSLVVTQEVSDEVDAIRAKSARAK